MTTLNEIFQSDTSLKNAIREVVNLSNTISSQQIVTNSGIKSTEELDAYIISGINVEFSASRLIDDAEKHLI